MFTVRLYDSLGSTHDEAARLAASGAPHGTVVSAHVQTRGRGRQGRRWISPVGNVYLSVILRYDDLPFGRLAEIGFVAALATAEAADRFHPGAARLKWPNDVLLAGAKLAGILVERAEAAALLGIGLNVRHAPEGAGYAAGCLGAGVDPEGARGVLLDALGQRLEAWRRDGFAPVRHDWLARAHPIGTPLRVGAPQAVDGRFAGLARDGALLLETAAGTVRVIAGDVAIA